MAPGPVRLAKRSWRLACPSIWRGTPRRSSAARSRSPGTAASKPPAPSAPRRLLLQEASDIAILQDTDGLDDEAGARADPARLAAWLEGRGLPASRYVEAKGGKVGPLLLEAADAVGAALLVAGTYRHSRLFEALFGGVTRAFLRAADGPHLLIAH